MDSEKIYSKGELFLGKYDTMQYKTSIKYSNIHKIEIRALRKNSKGKGVRMARPWPYLVLTDMNGRKARFAIYFFTKRTLKNLLTNLLEKCKKETGFTFDVDELLKIYADARFTVHEM